MNSLFRKTALALAAAGCFGTAGAAEVDTKGGIKVKSDDGNFVGEFGGRMHLDANVFDDDGTIDNENGTTFRRLRLQGKGTMYGVYEGFIQVDFNTARNADDASSTVIRDAYLAYSGFGPGKLYFGQIKTPMGLDELTSSNYITFVERALPVSAVANAHRRGVGYKGSTGNISYFGMLYGGPGIRDESDDQSESVGLGGRLTWTPIKDKTRLLHLGLSAAKEDAEGDIERPRGVSTRYETAFANSVNMLPNITDADGILRTGLEAAFVTGPFSVQAEYLTSKFDSALLDDPELGGAYVAFSYFLTGETRPYKASEGIFDRVKPEKKGGAWEATLRFSELEGEAAGMTDTKIDNVTAGLNYYVNPQVRFMVNLLKSEVDVGATQGDPKTLLVRTQFDF